MEPEVFDAGDPVKVAKRKTRVQLREDEKREKLRQLLAAPHFQEIMWDILTDCGVYRTSFVNDPYVTAFNEGQRQVGLQIIKRVFDADPNAYTQMRLSNNKKEE